MLVDGMKVKDAGGKKIELRIIPMELLRIVILSDNHF